MFTVNAFTRRLTYSVIQQRYYASKKSSKKATATQKAMDHFDDFYGSVFGARWESMRKALLRKRKYVALVNNFGDTDKTIEYLENRGAHNMKILIEVQKNFEEIYGTKSPEKIEAVNNDGFMNVIQSYQSQVESREVSDIYPSTIADAELPRNIQTSNKDDKIIEESEVKLLKNAGAATASEASLEYSLAHAEIDESRVIEPSLDMSAEALWQFIPATKLKGLDEWVPESQHYKYYADVKDFPLTIEPDLDIHFPEHLKVYTFEDENMSTFPEPKRSLTGVFNYYPMDGASIMPVLALGLVGGDRMLDLCAGPGGKALVALQTMLPEIVICNDVSVARVNRIIRVFRDYLYDFESTNKWADKTIFKRVDGRILIDDQPFDKVLVDVPCTTDRHSVMEDDNNIFRPNRIKERLKIPEMQSQLLHNALRLVKVGGTVVYSTCSLSPIQNDGVVHMALKFAFEQDNIRATIKDLTEAVKPYRSMFRLGSGSAAPKYGQLIMPHVKANFGPAYFTKITNGIGAVIDQDSDDD